MQYDWHGRYGISTKTFREQIRNLYLGTKRRVRSITISNTKCIKSLLQFIPMDVRGDSPSPMHRLEGEYGMGSLFPFNGYWGGEEKVCL